MKNKQKGFIVPLLIAVIALLVIGGGVYIYKNKKTEAPAVIDTGTQQTNQNQQQTNTQTSPVNTQTNNLPSQTDTSNWKTYTHSEYGFSFKYPSTLFVNRDDSNSGVGSALYITQEAGVPAPICGTSKDYLKVLALKDIAANGIQSSDQYIKVIEDAYKKASGEKTFNVTTGDQTIVRFDTVTSGQHDFIFKGKAFLDISYHKCAGGFIPFDDIVSTFKFTK